MDNSYGYSIYFNYSFHKNYSLIFFRRGFVKRGGKKKLATFGIKIGVHVRLEENEKIEYSEKHWRIQRIIETKEEGDSYKDDEINF